MHKQTTKRSENCVKQMACERLIAMIIQKSCEKVLLGPPSTLNSHARTQMNYTFVIIFDFKVIEWMHHDVKKTIN